MDETDLKTAHRVWGLLEDAEDGNPVAVSGRRRGQGRVFDTSDVGRTVFADTHRIRSLCGRICLIFRNFSRVPNVETGR